jgi:hypothetical protein
MFENTLNQIASSFKETVGTNNTDLPQSVRVVKTRRQRNRFAR